MMVISLGVMDKQQGAFVSVSVWDRVRERKVGDRESKLQSVASTLVNRIYICCLNIPHFRYEKHATVFARGFGPSMAGAGRKGEL